MSLLAYLAACGIGAVAALALRPVPPLARLAGLGGLGVAFVAALLVGPATRLTIGEVTLCGSEFSGFFLACAAGSALLLCVIGLATRNSEELAPAALASFAGLAVAMTSSDPAVALVAGAAAATAGALLMIHSAPVGGEDDGRLAELRTAGVVAVGLGLAAMAIVRPAWNGQNDGPVFGPAFLGLGLALAVRGGAVPFHVPAARLGRTAAPLSPALLLVWVPAGLGILAISWSATTFGIKSDWLNVAVSVVQTVALATLILGGLAALVHDELEEVVAYSILADASFVLLAMAARTDAAAEPARLWLLVFLVAKTGLAAWAAAVSRAFGTSNLDSLRGWLRRTPILGLALVAILIATLGWPGSAVYEARASIFSLALPDGLQFLFTASIVISVAVVGRLLVYGLLSPSVDVRSARSGGARGCRRSDRQDGGHLNHPDARYRPRTDASLHGTWKPAGRAAPQQDPGGEPDGGRSGDPGSGTRIRRTGCVERVPSRDPARRRGPCHSDTGTGTIALADGTAERPAYAGSAPIRRTVGVGLGRHRGGAKFQPGADQDLATGTRQHGLSPTCNPPGIPAP